MDRRFTGIVAGICLLATSPILANQQFNNCLKSYSGEANKYTACFNEISNQAVDARNKAFQESVAKSQQQFQQSQKNIPTTTTGGHTSQQPTTYQQPIQTQQPTHTIEKVTEKPAPQVEKKPTQRSKPPRRIQFY